MKALFAKVFVQVKTWGVPLLRTGITVFGVVFMASLARIDFTTFHFSDLSILGSLAAGAVGAGANAVVLAVQHLLPGVPNPKPPVA